MGEVKYWDGEDFTVLDSKNAKSVNGIKFRINEDILEYSNDGLTWSTQSNFSGSYNDLSDKPTIPNDTNQLAKTDVYTKTEVNDLMSSAGQGDMIKAVYDTNDNGIVDNAEKVSGFTVGTNVPSNAKFTDTVYSHPSTHPASMITGLPTKLPADGGTSDLTRGMIGDDTRAINSPPSEYMSSGGRYLGRAGWQTEFKDIATMGVGAHLSGTYCYVETKNPWSDPSGGYPIQIAYGNGNPVWRIGTSLTAWGEWSPMNSGGDANTVSGYTVNTNVPANAKFTDTNTITTINGKTGVIAKADVVALGIPAQDTVYSHPSSHPASIITESTTKRFVSDTEKSTWSNKANTSDIPNKFVHVGASAPTNSQMGWIDTSL